MKNKRIGELVDQDSVRAYILYHFGIKFHEYSEKTLEQACQEKGLKIEQMIRELEAPHKNLCATELPFFSYPIDLVIEYLKHAHFLFVKQKLPYIGQLVETFEPRHKGYEAVAKDLKILLPLFIEDFIHHIYEEEDTLFKYIKLLLQAMKGSYNHARLYYMMEKNSLHRFAVEHEAHDDEMEGIRKITKDYYLSTDAPLHVKVIYNELMALEKNLQIHARIENEILFPKALALESQMKSRLAEKAKFN